MRTIGPRKRQTATAEVLRRSATRSPTRSRCSAKSSRAAGGCSHHRWSSNTLVDDEALGTTARRRRCLQTEGVRTFPRPLSGGGVEHERCERTVLHYRDVPVPPTPTFLTARTVAGLLGIGTRAGAGADGVGLGRGIGGDLSPAAPGFTGERPPCFKTFADQAVIAIQNARMFKETLRGARAADRHRRGAAGHQPLGGRRGAGVRNPGQRPAPLRRRPDGVFLVADDLWIHAAGLARWWNRRDARRPKPLEQTITARVAQPLVQSTPTPRRRCPAAERCAAS